MNVAQGIAACQKTIFVLSAFAMLVPSLSWSNEYFSRLKKAGRKQSLLSDLVRPAEDRACVLRR
jgi:hypothetical protein